MTTRHVAIVGTTASGKSALSIEIARDQNDFEIIVADSMQGYRGMDIGTAKPTLEDRGKVAHHLVDVLDPSEEYSLALFLDLARSAISDIEKRGKRALIVGGTGLYVQALIDGYEMPGLFPEVRGELDKLDVEGLYRKLQVLDPQAAIKIEPDNQRRLLRALEVTIGSGRRFSDFGTSSELKIEATQVGIWMTRDLNNLRIHQRIEAMLESGWVDEIEVLLDSGPISRTAERAIGYSTLIMARQEGAGALDVVDEIVGATKAFARRQRVWFRRDQRIHWYGVSDNPAQVYPAVLADLAESL